MAVTPGDHERLKHALLATDKETRRLLAPLLELGPVQQLLITFLNDLSRSFEDHVWDPTTRDVLQRLGESGAGTDDVRSDVARIFAQQLQLQGQSPVVIGGADPSEEALMSEVDTSQADGKAKFKRGDYYAAMNAFTKSLRALLAYHQDQYYGKIIDPASWEEDDLRDRYVTLCCNVAVCAIKLRDCARIRLYATKALAINKKSSKALYALAKVDLMERKLDEAQSVVLTAAKYHPSNDQFPKLLREIELTHKQELQARSELRSMKEDREREDEELRKRREVEEAQLRAKQARAVEVTHLPTLEDDGMFVQRLNTYFMRIKQGLRVDIDPRFNPDNGEQPLFECNVYNSSTGDVLATGIEASSKKACKHAAAKCAVLALWKRKIEAGKLSPDEKEHWEKYQKAESVGISLAGPLKERDADDEDIIDTTSEEKDDKVIRLTSFERGLEPTALLNQLCTQRRLHVEFRNEDIPTTKFQPLFRCTCVVIGEEFAQAEAASKKKAKAEASRRAVEVAIEKGIIQFGKRGVLGENEHPSEDQEVAAVATEVA